MARRSMNGPCMTQRSRWGASEIAGCQGRPTVAAAGAAIAARITLVGALYGAPASKLIRLVASEDCIVATWQYDHNDSDYEPPKEPKSKRRGPFVVVGA